MTRIFLIGYYGYGNFGDEWLCQQSLKFLSEQHPKATFRILHRLRQRFKGGRFIHRFAPFDVLFALFWCDQVVFGGGSLFQTRSSIRSVMYYASVMCLAKLCGKPVIWLGQGAGPLNRLGRVILRLSMPRFATLNFRDVASRDLVLSCCPHHKGRVTVGSDLAFCDVPDRTAPLGDAIGLCVQPGIVDIVRDSGVLDENPIGLMAFEAQDAVVFEELGVATVSLLEHKESIRRCRVVVTSRYHVGILAALHQIPVILIGHDPKLVALGQQLDQPVVMTAEALRSQLSESFSASTYVPVLPDVRRIDDEVMIDGIRVMVCEMDAAVTRIMNHLGTVSTAQLSHHSVFPPLFRREGNSSSPALPKSRGGGEEFTHITTLNPEILVRATQSDRDWINTSLITTIDGIGVALAVRRKTGVWPARVTGIGLVTRLLHERLAIYCLGASTEVINKAVEKMGQHQATIVGHRSGFFEDLESVLEDIVAKRPDVILVGMGFPRQERIIQAMSERLSVGVAIGIGGVFDVLSGAVTRAPKWVQAIGMEWLYRSVQRPERLRRLRWIFPFLSKMR